MVSELGHHHMSQQACGRDAFVDHLRRYRYLDERFTLAAGPFSTDVLLDREHAWRADVFADALELAAAHALGVLWFLTDHSSWKLRRQRRTLGLLTRFGWCGRRIDRL